MDFSGGFQSGVFRWISHPGRRPHRRGGWLINRNTEELGEADVAWADVVTSGGMLLQQADTLEIVRLERISAELNRDSPAGLDS
jgi:hypothetical protein